MKSLPHMAAERNERYVQGSEPDDQSLFAEIDDLEQVNLVPGQGEDEGDISDPADTFTASVGSKDWTVETLVSQMRKGRIDLDPSFQRRNAWLGNRKSKLLESIMLGFPIPQIVLAEKRDAPGYYFVLDGKQRLLALRQFFVDPNDQRDEGFEPLRLSGLEVLPKLNRKDIAGLEQERPDLLAAIENHSIRTVVLSKWNSERLLLSLFLRLNTGSVALSPQELRQALIHGDFMRWLDRESGKSRPLRRLLGNTHADRRMVDAELTLRHLAFETSPLPYRGNLKQFLDDTSALYNNDWLSLEGKAENSLDQLNQAIDAAFGLFGADKICRKWSGTKYERALNRAVFDVQIYSLSHSNVRSASVGRGEEILDRFKRACEDDINFVRAVSTTTKTAEAFRTRHIAWRDIMRDAVGIDYELPAPLRRN